MATGARASDQPLGAEAPRVWGVADICDAVGVTHLTVYRWRERPGFPRSCRVNRGKTEVWDPAAVLEWVAAHSGADHARAAARDVLAGGRGGAQSASGI